MKQATVQQFRKRLAEVITRSGLTRAGFARKVSIDRSTLSQILTPATDRLPRVETLAAIAQSEQVSIDWLVGLSQEGGLRADILPQEVEFQPGGRSPSDERLAAWHEEAQDYKIRYVPTTLPDLMKTTDVIDYEYQASASATPEQRRQSSRMSLQLQRHAESDTEVCCSIQLLRTFAEGRDIWSDLPKSTRKAQLRHIVDLTRELYPTFRWFLYDGLNRFSVPLTIFGPKRAIIYLGQKYLVLNSREFIHVLSRHFDDLIRAATVQPPDVPKLVQELCDAV